MWWLKRTPPAQALAAFRLDSSYEVGLLPIWKMKRALAETLLALGMAKSALHLYEEIKLFNKIVHCYINMGRRAKAEEVVREQVGVLFLLNSSTFQQRIATSHH